jgi:hypothetical protein
MEKKIGVLASGFVGLALAVSTLTGEGENREISGSQGKLPNILEKKIALPKALKAGHEPSKWCEAINSDTADS